MWEIIAAAFGGYVTGVGHMVARPDHHEWLCDKMDALAKRLQTPTPQVAPIVEEPLSPEDERLVQEAEAAPMDEEDKEVKEVLNNLKQQTMEGLLAMSNSQFRLAVAAAKRGMKCYCESGKPGMACCIKAALRKRAERKAA